MGDRIGVQLPIKHAFFIALDEIASISDRTFLFCLLYIIMLSALFVYLLLRRDDIECATILFVNIPAT